MRKMFLAAIVRNVEIYSHIVIEKMILYTSHTSKKLTALAPISSSLFHSVARNWKESMTII